VFDLSNRESKDVKIFLAVTTWEFFSYLSLSISEDCDTLLFSLLTLVVTVLTSLLSFYYSTVGNGIGFITLLIALGFFPITYFVTFYFVSL